MARRSCEPVNRARDRESLLARGLRYWAGENRGRLWIAGRRAVSFRAAGLARPGVSRIRLGREEALSPYGYLRDVSSVSRGHGDKTPGGTWPSYAIAPSAESAPTPHSRLWLR